MHLLPQFLFNITNCLLAETCAIFYSYFIGNMIQFLVDPNIEKKYGFIYVGIFFTAQMSSNVLRNRFVMHGFENSIRVRKLLIALLYDKTIRLSVKGMTETNSGKLISLINGDLF